MTNLTSPHVIKYMESNQQVVKLLSQSIKELEDRVKKLESGTNE